MNEDAKPVSSTEERPHHKYSPSSLEYREACPCWDSRESKHKRTLAGSKAHKVVETGLDDVELEDDDAVAAAECLDFFETRKRLMEVEAQERMATLRASGVIPCPESFKVTELTEVYLPVDDLVFPDGVESTTAGYVDRVIINYNRTYAEMLDWKFGMWLVTEAKDNIQGICYVLGLFKKYPTIQAIRFWFKQPHLDHVSEAVFTREQIPALYLRVQAIVARCREAAKLGDYSLAKPQTPVCNFCGNLGRCPRGLEIALKVGKKFHPVEFPDDITPTQVMDPKDTSKALRLVQVVRVWADAFKRQVTDRVLRSEAPMPEGYRLETRNGNREITDMTKFKEVCLRFMTPDDYEKCLEASFGPLEELVSAKAPRGSKTAMVKEFQAALEQSGAIGRGDSYSFLKPFSQTK